MNSNSAKGIQGRARVGRAELWRISRDAPGIGERGFLRPRNELEAEAGRGREPRRLGILGHQDPGHSGR